MKESTYLERLYREMMEQSYLIQTLGSRYVLKCCEKKGRSGPWSKFFDSFEDALEKAEELLGPPWEKQKHKFTAVVRFDQGLGPQCVTLKEIEACTLKQAEAIAQDEATKLLGEDEWLEIKTRPSL